MAEAPSSTEKSKKSSSQHKKLPLTENDLDFDFQGHVISYSSAIFLGIKRGNFEHNGYEFKKIYSFEIFSHVNLISVSIPYEFRR